jgi:hypothetical protein
VLLFEILVLLPPELDELRGICRVQRDGWHALAMWTVQTRRVADSDCLI